MLGSLAVALAGTVPTQVPWSAVSVFPSDLSHSLSVRHHSLRHHIGIHCCDKMPHPGTLTPQELFHPTFLTGHLGAKLSEA